MLSIFSKREIRFFALLHLRIVRSVPESIVIPLQKVGKKRDYFYFLFLIHKSRMLIIFDAKNRAKNFSSNFVKNFRTD